jgi:hypothetical protein
MRKHLALTAAALVAFSTVAAGPAQSRADVDHEVALAIGEDATVAGGVAGGVNPDYFTASAFGATCNHDPHTYCETVLINVSNPFEEENAKKGRERATLFINMAPTQPVADFDLVVYESDEDGTVGSEIGRSGQTPVADNMESSESVTAVISTTKDETEVWVIAHVIYFAAPSDYTMDVSFTQ